MLIVWSPMTNCTVRRKIIWTVGGESTLVRSQSKVIWNNVFRRIQITRCNDDFKVGMCSRRRSGQESRKLQADLDMIISSGSDNRMTARLNDAVFEPSAGYCSQGKDIFKWGSVVDFLADGCLKVEVRVNITGSVVAPPISNGMDEFRQERYVNVRSFIDKYAPDKRSETIKQQLPNNITQVSQQPTVYGFSWYFSEFSKKFFYKISPIFPNSESVCKILLISQEGHRFGVRKK